MGVTSSKVDSYKNKTIPVFSIRKNDHLVSYSEKIEISESVVSQQQDWHFNRKNSIIDKSMIGNPIGFIHLSHAGTDHTENYYYSPIPNAQISDVSKPTNHYVNHCYPYSLTDQSKPTKALTYTDPYQYKKLHSYDIGTFKIDQSALFFDERYKKMALL